MARIAIFDGNLVETREVHIKRFGATLGDRYKSVINFLDPNAAVDVLYTSDCIDDAVFDPRRYSGVAICGCNLHVYEQSDGVMRQLELLHRVCIAGVPVFGSCWGLQIMCVVSGGVVGPCRNGLEFGLAKNIRILSEHKEHPMLRGRQDKFEEFAFHYDEILKFPPKCRVLAFNDHSHCQAIEIQFERSCIWAVQYHPEFSRRDAVTSLKLLAGTSVGQYQLDQIREKRLELINLHMSSKTKSCTATMDPHESGFKTSFCHLELSNWLKFLNNKI